MKLLFWIVVLAAFFFLLGFKRARPTRPSAPPPAPPPAPSLPEDMVRCAECGMHLPASESLPGRGGQFCSPDHRASHEARLSRNTQP